MNIFVSYVGINSNDINYLYGNVIYTIDKLTSEVVDDFRKDIKKNIPEQFNPVILNMIKLDD